MFSSSKPETEKSVSKISEAARKLRYSGLPIVKALVQSKPGLDLHEDHTDHAKPPYSEARANNDELTLSNSSPTQSENDISQEKKPLFDSKSYSSKASFSAPFQEYHSTPIKRDQNKVPYWREHKLTWFDRSSTEIESRTHSPKLHSARIINAPITKLEPEPTPPKTDAEVEGSSTASNLMHASVGSSTKSSIVSSDFQKHYPHRKYGIMRSIIAWVFFLGVVGCFFYAQRLKNAYLAELREFTVIQGPNIPWLKDYNWDILNEVAEADRRKRLSQMEERY